MLDQLHDAQAERALIGTLLFQPLQVIPLAAQELHPEDFHDSDHRAAFQAMLALFREKGNVPLDALINVLVAKGWDRGKAGEYVEDTYYSAESEKRYRALADVVRGYSQRRRFAHAAEKIAKYAREGSISPAGLVDAAGAVLAEATDMRGSRRVTWAESIPAHLARILDEMKHGKKTGPASGFVDLDRMIGGFNPGRLYLVAARPRTGKSLLKNAMMINQAKAGAGVVACEIEMNEDEQNDRLLADVSSVLHTNIDRRTLTDEQLAALNKGSARLATESIRAYYDPTLTPGKLDAIVARERMLAPLDVVYVDHLHLMQPGRNVKNRVEAYSIISWELKRIAKKYDVAVVALAQLNRSLENRGDKRPILSDLRESGSLEQDADCVMFLYRDELHDENTDRPNVMEVILAKNRSGPSGVVDLYVHLPMMQIRNLASKAEELNGRYKAGKVAKIPF